MSVLNEPESKNVVAAVQAGQVSTEEIIIDAKSGVSGAGRAAKQNLLYTEIAEGINSYGVSSHRHMPEIEQVWVLTSTSVQLPSTLSASLQLGTFHHLTSHRFVPLETESPECRKACLLNFLHARRA